MKKKSRENISTIQCSPTERRNLPFFVFYDFLRMKRHCITCNIRIIGVWKLKRIASDTTMRPYAHMVVTLWSCYLPPLLLLLLLTLRKTTLTRRAFRWNIARDLDFHTRARAYRRSIPYKSLDCPRTTRHTPFVTMRAHIRVYSSTCARLSGTFTGNPRAR